MEETTPQSAGAPNSGDISPLTHEDGGEATQGEERDKSIRRCLVTATRLEKKELLRFVIGPQDRVYFDLSQKLPGRGLYIGAGRELLETAVKKRLFAKAARKAVTVPPDLVDSVEMALKGRIINQISLANKAGRVVAGHDKVHALISSGKAAILIQASDGSVDSREKMTRLAKAVPGRCAIHAFCTSADLVRAIGREGVVHMAIRKGPFAQGIEELIKNFTNFADETLNKTTKKAI